MISSIEASPSHRPLRAGEIQGADSRLGYVNRVSLPSPNFLFLFLSSFQYGSMALKDIASTTLDLYQIHCLESSKLDLICPEVTLNSSTEFV